MADPVDKSDQPKPTMAPSILDNNHQAKMMDEPQHYQSSPRETADGDQKQLNFKTHHAPPVVRKHSTAKPLESSQTKRSPPDGGRPPQGVYVGIEFEPMGDTPCFAIYVHDGFCEYASGIISLGSCFPSGHHADTITTGGIIAHRRHGLYHQNAGPKHRHPTLRRTILFFLPRPRSRRHRNF